MWNAALHMMVSPLKAVGLISSSAPPPPPLSKKRLGPACFRPPLPARKSVRARFKHPSGAALTPLLRPARWSHSAASISSNGPSSPFTDTDSSSVDDDSMDGVTAVDTDGATAVDEVEESTDSDCMDEDSDILRMQFGDHLRCRVDSGFKAAQEVVQNPDAIERRIAEREARDRLILKKKALPPPAKRRLHNAALNEQRKWEKQLAALEHARSERCRVYDAEWVPFFHPDPLIGIPPPLEFSDIPWPVFVSAEELMLQGKGCVNRRLLLEFWLHPAHADARFSSRERLLREYKKWDPQFFTVHILPYVVDEHKAPVGSLAARIADTLAAVLRSPIS